MPKYKKKITRPMDYDEFKAKVEEYRNPLTGKPLPQSRKAFLNLLFFTGCRISEALALTAGDIYCTPDTIYVLFFRLKGSKQTDSQEIPRADALKWLCLRKGKLFPFSRITGNRLVTSCFPDLYPHYFRMNRITKVLEQFGVVAVQNTFGLSLNAIQSYIGKLDIKRVGKALHKEIEQ